MGFTVTLCRDWHQQALARQQSIIGMRTSTFSAAVMTAALQMTSVATENTHWHA